MCQAKKLQTDEKRQKNDKKNLTGPEAGRDDFINRLKTIPYGTVLSWGEVAGIHSVRNGVYQRGGRLVSLLTDFGRLNPCYPDFTGGREDEIFYTGAGRRGDQKLDAPNRALLDAVKSGHSVPLFNKLAVGRWEFLGFWRVAEGSYVFDEKNERMIWRFRLKRAAES